MSEGPSQPFSTQDNSSGFGGGQAPPAASNKGGGNGDTPTDYENEPPILEELGIDPKEIMKKFTAILTQRGFKEVCTYEDMAGAIFVLFLFGFCLLLVS